MKSAIYKNVQEETTFLTNAATATKHHVPSRIMKGM